MRGERRPRPETLTRLAQAVPRLEEAKREQTDHEQAVLEAVRARSQDQSGRRFAARADVHYPHLTEILTGSRKPSGATLDKLVAALATS